MKDIKIIFIALIAFCSLFASCEKDDLIRFKADTAVNFDRISNLYSTQYSFIANSTGEYIQELPVKILGDTVDYDRHFKVEVVDDTVTTATPDQYEIVDGVVEAGQFSGKLSIKLKNSAALDNSTVSLKVRIINSDDFKVGNVESREFVVSWTNQIIVPTWSVYYRTFFTSVGSTAAFRLFIQITGMTQFTAKEYSALGAAGVEALATKYGDYIMQWNKDHPNDILVHDDGTAKGQPIVPLYYTHSKYD